MDIQVRFRRFEDVLDVDVDLADARASGPELLGRRTYVRM